MLQISIFVAFFLFFSFFLFISSNIDMKCLICLCMVSYTLYMHIGSLWGLTIFIWSFDLERSWSKSKVKIKVTRTCDPSNWSYRRLEYDGDEINHLQTELDYWGKGQDSKCQTLSLYSLLYIGYAHRKSMAVGIFLFDLERSQWRSMVNVTRACDLSNRSYCLLEYDGDKIFYVGANFD